MQVFKKVAVAFAGMKDFPAAPIDLYPHKPRGKDDFQDALFRVGFQPVRAPVGGKVLARLLAEMQYGGTVAATGLTGGKDLHTTVMPFILRAIKMVGVEVTTCPIALRKTAWKRLAKELPDSILEQVYQVISLAEVPAFSAKLLAGQVNGRLVVDLEL